MATFPTAGWLGGPRFLGFFFHQAGWISTWFTAFVIRFIMFLLFRYVPVPTGFSTDFFTIHSLSPHQHLHQVGHPSLPPKGWKVWYNQASLPSLHIPAGWIMDIIASNFLYSSSIVSFSSLSGLASQSQPSSMTVFSSGSPSFWKILSLPPSSLDLGYFYAKKL